MTTDGANLSDAGAVADMFIRAAGAMRQSRHRMASRVQLPGDGRLVVTGDLHDHPAHFKKIVALARLERSTDHHVVFQEMIHSQRLVNGVDLSHRMLARVAALVVQHPDQVHPILANHELAQMTRRSVSKGAGDNVRLFNQGLEFVFSDAWERVAESIDTFIRAMPIALMTESRVCCAHSLPSPRAMEQFDFNIIKRELTDDDYETKTGSAYLMTWGRGHTDEQIERIASLWNVDLFFLGHEQVETGCEMFGPRLVKINSDHEHGAVVIVDLASPPTAEEAMMSAVHLRALSLPD